MIIKNLKNVPNLSHYPEVCELTLTVKIDSKLYDLIYYVEVEIEDSTIRNGFKNYTLNIIKDIYMYISGTDKGVSRNIKVLNCETFYSMINRDVSGQL